MKCIFTPECNNQVLFENINLLNPKGAILLLATDENDLDLFELHYFLKQSEHKIIGGIYPKIIYENQLISKGLIVASLDDELDITILTNISQTQNLDEMIESICIDNIKTMFVLVDGLSKNINNIIKSLFDNFGLTINYIGGGAGSLSFVQQPVLFSNKGILQDACILASSKLSSSIGVKHGWQSISEPLKVTKSQGNTIIELDYKQAFEVYKDIVETTSSHIFEDDNFFDISKSFPFGINKISGEMVVRDPIILNNEGIVCVGEVPQGSFVNILHGKDETLINAAFEAHTEATSNCDFEYFTLFIDCISRVLFLEDRFQHELNAIHDNKSSMIGMLTLGEIANNKKHYLEFYNKTAVVSKLEHKL